MHATDDGASRARQTSRNKIRRDMKSLDWGGDATTCIKTLNKGRFALMVFPALAPDTHFPKAKSESMSALWTTLSV